MSASPGSPGTPGVGRPDDSGPAPAGLVPQPPVPQPPVPPPGTGAGGASQPTGRPRPGRGPWLVSLAAAGIAVLSIVVSLYAVLDAQDARRRADAAALAAAGTPDRAGQAQTPKVSTPTAGSTRPAARPTATPLGVLNPLANYGLHYSGEKLNPQATESASAYIDLDEPRVARDGADIMLTLGYNSTVPNLQTRNDTQVARATGYPLEPKACAELIRTSPLNVEQIPVQQDTTLCLATDIAQAQKQGIKQHMVLLRVTGVSRDGTVSIEVTAWEVPD